MSDFRIATRTNFLGTDAIVQGEDWSRVARFQKNTNTDPDGDPTWVDVDMSAYRPEFGGLVRGAVKSQDLQTTYFSTEAGSMALSWLDNSRLTIAITDNASTALTATIPSSARIQIEGVKSTGVVQRILEGRIEMKANEVVKAAT